ncbi:MAG: hypothetical protein KAR79_05155, partial [Simkaniaceae bacterium]|nr:hypothetical protein [Simkaniaceae bacterium]
MAIVAFQPGQELAQQVPLADTPAQRRAQMKAAMRASIAATCNQVGQQTIAGIDCAHQNRDAAGACGGAIGAAAATAPVIASGDCGPSTVQTAACGGYRAGKAATERGVDICHRDVRSHVPQAARATA